MTRGKSNNSSCSFNEEDRELLQNINKTMKDLKEEIKSLRDELNKSKKDLKMTQSENQRLKQALNLTNFKLDELEQYGRRENIRIHNISESENENDDGADVLFKVADALKIELDERDIQRVHRIGAKKTSKNAKPRPVIARFVSFQKRNQFLFEKSKLKGSRYLSNAFITEDLTPLRSKLLNYIKYECNDEFVLCHSYNGKIRMKKSSIKAGLPLDKNGKDQGTGKWLTVSSIDDLFKYNVDIDFEKLNYLPLKYNNNLATDQSDSESDSKDI